MRTVWSLAAAVLVAGVVGLAVRNRSTDDPAAPSEVSPSHASPDHQERLRRGLVGVWTDDYQGKRTMTLNADGTGTMIVELSGWRAALSASRLRFDMLWTLQAERLEMRTVGGEPAGQVQAILKTFGDRAEQPILELTDDRLLLLDGDGRTRYDWRKKRG